MDSIHIQGYKSIKEATIELRPINILIGGNGSGKSNFLSFFEFLNKLYERNLQEYVALNGGMEKMLHGGLNGAKAISSSIVFSKGISEFSFNLERGLVSFVFTEEDLRYINFHKKVATFDSESYAKRAIHDQNRTEHMVSQLEDLKKYHLNDTGKQSPFIQSSHIQNDSYFLYEDGRNIAAYLYSIKKNHSQHYNIVVNIIQSIAPYFADFYLEPNENGFIWLQWRDKYTTTVYGATDLSDGTIRFIALTVLFMQPKLPATIIIDEPELGLHPQAIGMLAGMMQSAAARGTQIIAATQSVELIDDFQPEDIIAVDLVDGESVYARLNNESISSWLENYTLGDLWKRNVIGKGQP
jgi:predicted ATPase